MASQPRDDVLRGLTRGLRDALGAIDGYASLIEEDVVESVTLAVEDAEHVRTAVKHALAFVAQLEQLVDAERRTAARDPLTQVANRRALTEIGERLFDDGDQFSVVLIDVDKFKLINDTLGHATGDAVLRGIMDRCRPLVRDSDVLGRLAGDEFVVVLPGANPELATRIAERLGAQVAQEPIETPTGSATVTISLGTATRKPEDVNFDAVLARADTAMYTAKRNGRNQIAAA